MIDSSHKVETYKEMEYEDTFVTDMEGLCETKHGRTWDVLLQVHLRTSMNGSQNPNNISQDVTVEQAVTVLRRGHTVISCRTTCHDTNDHNVHLTDILTSQNEVTQNKPVYKSLLPPCFTSSTPLYISCCVYSDVGKYNICW